MAVTRGDVDEAELKADLHRHAKEKHADFKVPKLVYIVEDLPKNASGKIPKRELCDEFPQE